MADPAHGGFVIYTFAILASFGAVFLKIFQLQNVNGKHIKTAMATSYAIALFDVAVILVIIKGGWWVFLLTGTGGALGLLCSMKLHGKIFKS